MKTRKKEGKNEVMRRRVEEKNDGDAEVKGGKYFGG